MKLVKKHTKTTVDYYLDKIQSPEMNLKFLYGVENQLKNHSTNALKKDLTSAEKTLLVYVKSLIKKYKAELKNEVLNGENKPEKAETNKFPDGRKKHGEKGAIIKYWQENKVTYLTDKYKFKASGFYNKSKIARHIQREGGFSSHPSTIIDYANLGDLEN